MAKAKAQITSPSREKWLTAVSNTRTPTPAASTAAPNFGPTVDAISPISTTMTKGAKSMLTKYETLSQ